MQYSWFQSVKYYTGIISLGVLLGFGLQFAQAWSNPTQSAPNGNVAGPVNTGLLTQIKQGSLGLLGNLSAGLVQLNTIVTEGSPCASTGLVGRDTNGVVLSCQGGVWRKGSGGGVGKKACLMGVARPTFATPSDGWENSFNVPDSWSILDCGNAAQHRVSAHTTGLQYRYAVGCLDDHTLTMNWSNAYNPQTLPTAILPPSGNTCGW